MVITSDQLRQLKELDMANATKANAPFLEHDVNFFTHITQVRCVRCVRRVRWHCC
jgi:DNA-binding FadR family transcriptional regulator